VLCLLLLLLSVLLQWQRQTLRFAAAWASVQ
jgi:hypothetical protein